MFRWDTCDGSAAGGAEQCAFLPYIMKDAPTRRSPSRRFFRVTQAESFAIEEMNLWINRQMALAELRILTPWKQLSAFSIPNGLLKTYKKSSHKI